MQCTPLHRASRAILGTSLLLGLASTPAAAQAPQTVIASVASNGTPGSTHVGQVDLSANGRYVVFTTASPAIVPTGGGQQVARHDLETGETILVSATSAGLPAGGVCESPRVSADGRFVSFSTYASNLDPNDTNNKSDIYLHDVDTGANWFVSRGSSGHGGNAFTFNHAISADGRYVAFASAATNILPEDTNDVGDVFVFDRVTDTVEMVSVTQSGEFGDLGSFVPSISADGRYVAFQSSATTFHFADVNGLTDVFVKDRVTGTLTLVSARPEGIPGNGESTRASISDDGTRVAFQSRATDLGPPDDPFTASMNVFVRDLQARTTEMIDLDVFGGPSPNEAEHPRISSDGRFVVFESTHADLVIGDTNSTSDVFLHDRTRHETVRVNVTNDEQQSEGWSGGPAVSADGTRVAFLTWGNLVAEDVNGLIDAYVRISPTLTGTTFCSGDGSATECPCANGGALGSGCASATQGYGGHLLALGTASVSDDSLILRGEGLSTSFVTYFQGTASVNAGLGITLGDGLLCAGGSLLRLGTKLSPGGVSSYPDEGEELISIRGQIPLQGGVTRTYQARYRSAAPFCTPDTFNYTNGVELVWQP